ncbi:MAG: hypothetical protein ACR2NA_07625 [Solirubrobacterales bacterium]
MAVVRDDLADPGLGERITDLAGRRMGNTERGALCPLDILPAPECAGAVEELIAGLHLRRSQHISVYREAEATAA